MIEDKEKSFYRHISSLQYNNIEKIISNQANLKVVNVADAHHLNIIDNEALLSSEIIKLNKFVDSTDLLAS